MNQYRHSGTAPLGGVAMTLLAGGAATVVLSLIYPWLLRYIPLIFLNVLCTMGLGYGIGLAVGSAAKMGHLRNNLILTVLAFGLTCVGLYLAWAGFLWAIFGQNIGMKALHPQMLWELGGIIYEKGTWGVGKGRNNATVSGIALGVVWLIEAGTLFWLSITTARTVGGETPYCENCSRWTEVAKSARILNATGLESYWNEAAEGKLIAINQAPVGHAALDHSVHLDLATCPKCQELNVLTIRSVAKKRDSKGKESTTEKNIARDLLINPREAEFVRLCGAEEEVPADDEGDMAAAPETSTPEA